MRQTTLCLLLTNDSVLLAMKKTGFGQGKWNGCGGKPEAGESIEETALREMREEIGVTVKLKDLQKVGTLQFYFPDKKEWNQEVVIFTINKWSGEPVETDEMKPQWFKFSEIPYDQMWPDDKYWLPKVLTGKKLSGKFYFNQEHNGFTSFDLTDSP